MNISLRSKLERLSNAKKQIRAADYTDTFEEVLREEMEAMKAGFQAKLAAARDEVEELQRRHGQEMDFLRLRRGSISLTPNGTLA
mmetsp:Transcript_21774/g.66671  ORF Transcript_21774/g.66671 Transcript_21774/m.66671 type:complete len:85 (+) Transcript_21774:134-388(+)